MTAAVIFLWAGCIWSIVQSVCCFLLTASLWRRLLVLAVLVLAASSCHVPQEKPFKD